MRVYIGLVVVSVLLVHAAGAWVYIFFGILQRSEVALCELNRPILMAEFGMAAVWTLAGIFFLVMAIIKCPHK